MTEQRYDANGRPIDMWLRTATVGGVDGYIYFPRSSRDKIVVDEFGNFSFPDGCPPYVDIDDMLIQAKVQRNLENANLLAIEITKLHDKDLH